MKTLKIHPELQTLLPALSDEEYKGLETDILEHGCLSPLVTWDDTIVDGHNRYTICQRHGLPFDVKPLEFSSLDDAKFWAWTHQENQRNLTSFQKAELALKFKPMLVAKGKENMSAGGGDKVSSNAKAGFQISGNPVNETVHVDKELAKTAGISHDTMHKAEFLSEHADEETKKKLRQGKTSINKEYKRAKEKAADSKPQTTRTKKTSEEPSATEPQREPETTESSPSQNVPCINELENVKRTTLKDIRHDDPDYLLCNLATHFRKGYIEDLILKGMEFLYEKEGEKKTTPLAKEIAKRYLKTKP